MKILIITLVLTAASLVRAYEHDDLYKSYARPYADQCEAKASNAGVSRPNVQILTNNCLHDYLVKASRKIIAETPSYAKASGRDKNQSLREAREEATKALYLYQKGVYIHPGTDEVSMGSHAQKNLEIELGRKIDQLKIMENQPSLLIEEE